MVTLNNLNQKQNISLNSKQLNSSSIKFQGNKNSNESNKNIDSLNIINDEEFAAKHKDFIELKEKAKKEKSKTIKTLFNYSAAATAAAVSILAFKKAYRVAGDQIGLAKEKIINSNIFNRAKKIVLSLIKPVKNNINKTYNDFKYKTFKKANKNNNVASKILKTVINKSENSIKQIIKTTENLKKTINIDKVVENASSACVATYAGIETLQEVSKNND